MKLIDNTQLNLLINCITCNKPFFTKSIFLIFFILLLSLIFLTLLFYFLLPIYCTYTINFSSITSIFSTFNNKHSCSKLCHIFSFRMVSLYTKKAENVTSTPSIKIIIFDKKIPDFIPVYCYLIMLYFRTPNISFFEGSNIINFFNWYNQMYIDY